MTSSRGVVRHPPVRSICANRGSECRRGREDDDDSFARQPERTGRGGFRLSRNIRAYARTVARSNARKAGSNSTHTHTHSPICGCETNPILYILFFYYPSLIALIIVSIQRRAENEFVSVFAYVLRNKRAHVLTRVSSDESSPSIQSICGTGYHAVRACECVRATAQDPFCLFRRARAHTTHEPQHMRPCRAVRCGAVRCKLRCHCLMPEPNGKP